MEQSSSEKIERLILKIEMDQKMGSPFYHEFAYYVLGRFHLHSDEVEDIWQNAFLKLTCENNSGKIGIHSYAYYIDDTTPLTNDTQLKPWLRTVLFNSCKDYIQRKKRREKRFSDWMMESNLGEDFMLEFQSSEPSPLDRILEKEQKEILHSAVNNLDEIHKQIISLVGLYGLKYREAAEVLHTPVGTIKSRYHYARKSLEEAYQKVA